jgi:hypothetical protein
MYIPTTQLTQSGSGGSSLLAVVGYAPGSDSTIGSVTGATIADFDAANLSCTFTAPASGNVLVILEGLQGSAGTDTTYFAVREGAVTLGQIFLEGSSTTNGRRKTATFYFTGVSAGSHTYKFAGKCPGGQVLLYGGPTYGQAIIAIYGAP